MPCHFPDAHLDCAAERHGARAPEDPPSVGLRVAPARRPTRAAADARAAPVPRLLGLAGHADHLEGDHRRQERRRRSRSRARRLAPTCGRSLFGAEDLRRALLVAEPERTALPLVPRLVRARLPRVDLRPATRSRATEWPTLETLSQRGPGSGPPTAGSRSTSTRSRSGRSEGGSEGRAREPCSANARFGALAPSANARTR